MFFWALLFGFAMLVMIVLLMALIGSGWGWLIVVLPLLVWAVYNLRKDKVRN